LHQSKKTPIAFHLVASEKLIRPPSFRVEPVDPPRHSPALAKALARRNAKLAERLAVVTPLTARKDAMPNFRPSGLLAAKTRAGVYVADV